MAATKNRPISPHMQVWRWGPAMLVSILHRVTGNGLAVVGMAVLLYWLGSLSAGPGAYEAFLGHASAWYGKVVLVGLTWAFFNHMASGIRHFVLDIGAGYELDINRMWSVAAPVIGILLTAAFWAAVLLK